MDICESCGAQIDEDEPHYYTRDEGGGRMRRVCENCLDADDKQNLDRWNTADAVAMHAMVG